MLTLLFYLFILKLDNMYLLNSFYGFCASIGITEGILQAVETSPGANFKLADEPLYALIIACVTAVTNLVIFLLKRKTKK